MKSKVSSNNHKPFLCICHEKGKINNLCPQHGESIKLALHEIIQKSNKEIEMSIYVFINYEFYGVYQKACWDKLKLINIFGAFEHTQIYSVCHDLS